MKKKLTYSDINLLDKVKSPNGRHIGEITAINNMASIAKVNEPIFHVNFGKEYPGGSEYFGLKYVLKMIVK